MLPHQHGLSLLIQPQKIQKVESDTNFDGKADHWEFFDSSEKLIRKESDRNFDGKPDLVENQ